MQLDRHSREERSRGGSSRGSVMLTRTKLGSWTPGSAARKLPWLQVPKQPCICRLAFVSKLHLITIS